MFDLLRSVRVNLIYLLHCCQLRGFWSCMRYVNGLILLFFSGHFELRFANIIVKKNLLSQEIEEKYGWIKLA